MPPTSRASVRSVAAKPDAITLAAALRARLPGQSWNALRRLCETGKVRLNGTVTIDSAIRVPPDADITIDMTAPRPRRDVPGFRIVFEDPHLIVIEKPAGTTSVPFEPKETGTALDLIRNAWREQHRRATATPLYTVHRLDKETSGLLCFAKTRQSERGLHQVFQQHLARRTYLAVAQGVVSSRRMASRLISDRGDGLRGSTRDPNEGQYAVTHVEVIEHLAESSLCRIRLETGRTHQIRIHLAEAGHPIVGDKVYTRDLLMEGGAPLSSTRMMLHAETLGFQHPVTDDALDFSAPAPEDFTLMLSRLRHREVAR